MKDENIEALLSLKTWAIVGLSSNQLRPAYGVAALLHKRGHRVIAVHPKGEELFGERGYKTLAEIPFPIDVVDLFVNSALAGAVVDEAIAIGAKGVWLQLEVIDELACQRAERAGLITVMNRCPAIEYGLQSKN